MILTQLDIASFRNIDKLSLSPHPRLNLIAGSNGTGKSSILESVQCLSTGHSFRTRKARELIQREAPCFTLLGQFTDPVSAREHRAGLSRQRSGSVELRLDYEDIHSMSVVTRLLPIKALTPDSHKLVQDGPDVRRQFLDWGVFHMEPAFFGIWKQFKRSLSQRNQLLRELSTDEEIQAWDALFLESAMALHAMRSHYVSRLSEALESRLTSTGAEFHVELQYRSGWSEDYSLAEQLTRNLGYHRRMKTTTDGPHRAELIISSGGVNARQLLSRGEQKLLVYLLHLSQLDILASEHSRKAIVLCDDLTSELDENNSNELIKQLISLDSQIFVSGVDLELLSHHSHNMFHMEHGNVKNVV